MVLETQVAANGNTLREMEFDLGDQCMPGSVNKQGMNYF
jgi:hypothetical protein